MGYYKGNGVVVGGGESVSPINSYYLNGSQHTVHRIDISVITMKNGVSLSTAQSEHGDESLSSWWADSTWIPSFTPAARGTRKTVSYSQIGGSNLYALSITNETFKAKLDNGYWQS